MSVFQLSKALYREINSPMFRFWWASKENDTKIAWMSWLKIWSSKSLGGLGFGELLCFNKMMLAKQR
jgi:hypothetical protein